MFRILRRSAERRAGALSGRDRAIPKAFTASTVIVAITNVIAIIATGAFIAIFAIAVMPRSPLSYRHGRIITAQSINHCYHRNLRHHRLIARIAITTTIVRSYLSQGAVVESLG